LRLKLLDAARDLGGDVHEVDRLERGGAGNLHLFRVKQGEDDGADRQCGTEKIPTAAGAQVADAPAVERVGPA